MNRADETRIMASRSRALAAVLGACVFVAAGFWLLSLDDATIRSLRGHDHPLVVRGFAVVAIVFFGACAVKAGASLFDRKPRLVLNESGLIDCSGGTAAGPVAWPEIVDMGLRYVRRQEMLVVTVRDPHKYAERGSKLQRSLMKANQAMWGSPIVIAIGTLAIRSSRLQSLLQHYRRKYGAA